jgi:hypothetical protein
MQNNPSSFAGYVVAAIDLMEKHSVRRESIDWSRFRETAIAEAQAATTIAECYPVIRAALRRLKDAAGADILRKYRILNTSKTDHTHNVPCRMSGRRRGVDSENPGTWPGLPPPTYQAGEAVRRRSSKITTKMISFVHMVGSFWKRPCTSAKAHRMRAARLQARTSPDLTMPNHAIRDKSDPIAGTWSGLTWEA